MRNPSVSFPVSRLAATIALALAPIAASAAPAGTQAASAPSSESGARPFIVAAAMALPQGVVPKAAVAPTASASPTSVDFGQVVVGTTSGTQNVTISYSAGFTFVGFDSYGGPPCYGAGIYGGPFSYTSSCTPGTAASAGTCQFQAQYSPFFYQTDSLTVYVCDSSLSPAASFTLTGQGIPQPPVTAGPNPFDFGDVKVGTQSAPNRFGFFNPGPLAVNIGPPFTTGNFSLDETDCTNVLGPGSSCTATVSFQPQQEGAVTGELILPPDFSALMAPEISKFLVICDCSFVAAIELSGNGVFQSQMQVSPDSVTFAPYTLGNPPESETVTVTNTGNSLLTMGNVSATSPFTVANTCPNTLQQNESCTVIVGFSATAAGAVTGTLSISSNGGSASIPLSATAQLIPVPILNVSPLVIGFGNRMIGSSTTAQRVTVKNVGGAPATMNPLAISFDFTIENTSCGASLAPGTSCTVDVSFRPVGFGPRGGTLTVTGNDTESPHVVNLTGSGCRPFMVGRGSNCSP
jgi:HYDIN/CFA65/VesB family protein/ASPM-SPD-2-Hydin domain-containing protein